MSTPAESASMTDTQKKVANDAVTARKMITCFDKFSKAYDAYVREMDDLVCSVEWNTPLSRKSRFLVTGLDSSHLFMKCAKDVVEWNIWPFVRK